MIYPYGITLLILCPLIFLASFIDSIAGGGGLISLPAYVFVGIPIHYAYGTNKFPATMGTAMAVTNYIRGGCVDFTAAVPGSIGALIGSLIGTRLAISLSPKALQLCLMIILPVVGVFILSRRGKENDHHEINRSKRFKVLFSLLIGLIFGWYDGFFGPGAGMFMTLTLSGLVGLDLIKSVGTTKLMNFSSNFTSMVTWVINGSVLFSLAIPCTLCSVAGGFFGSRLTMKIGKKIIRLVLALVTVMLFVKILVDVIKG